MAPAPRPEIVVADDWPRWSTPRRRASAPSPRPRSRRAGGSASRWRAARRRARSTLPWSTGIDWTRAEVFFGDERAVPPDDAQSNYRMARETLLDPAARAGGERRSAGAPRPPTWTPPRATTSRPCARAAGPPWLDLALLGLGPDGHTASLFPGTAALAEQRPPGGRRRRSRGRRPPPDAHLPGPARRRRRLLPGRRRATKRAALADVMRPDSTLPAARIVHRAAPVSIFCDRDAAQDITSPS